MDYEQIVEELNEISYKSNSNEKKIECNNFQVHS